MTTTKHLPAVSIKADDEGEGIIDALVATWDPDSVGDQIEKGAFAESLKDWAGRDENIPVIWSHQHNDPFAHIGEVIEASETDDGLQVRQQLDLDNPTAKQVYRLVKGGRIRNYSFAYDVEDAEPSKSDEGVTKLKKLKVYEVGPTLIGANQETRTLDVKSDAERHITLKFHGPWAADEQEALAGVLHRFNAEIAGKAGRTISSKNETRLREARDAIDQVLSSLDDESSKADDSADSKGTNAQPTGPDKTDDRSADDPQGQGASGKAEDPNLSGPVDALARYDALLRMS